MTTAVFQGQRRLPSRREQPSCESRPRLSPNSLLDGCFVRARRRGPESTHGRRTADDPRALQGRVRPHLLLWDQSEQHGARMLADGPALDMIEASAPGDERTGRSRPQVPEVELDLVPGPAARAVHPERCRPRLPHRGDEGSCGLVVPHVPHGVVSVKPADLRRGPLPPQPGHHFGEPVDGFVPVGGHVSLGILTRRLQRLFGGHGPQLPSPSRDPHHGNGQEHGHPRIDHPRGVVHDPACLPKKFAEQFPRGFGHELELKEPSGR